MSGRRRQAFAFRPFSEKQLRLLTWWMPQSPYADWDGIIADGAIRSGKTIAMIVGFVLWSVKCHSGQNFIISGKSIGALKRNVVAPLQQILRTLRIDFTYHRSENYLAFGGNTYYLFGANNEASQDVLVGLTAAGWFADQIELHPQSFIEQAVGRCSIAGSKYWWNCNPDSPYHHVKVELIDKAKAKRLVYLHFDLDDNLTLSEGVKARYRRMYSGVFYKRMILGLWVAAEGAIYDMFDPAVHVLDAVPPDVSISQYFIGIDYGTTNPTVFLLLGKGSDDRLYVVDEYRWDSVKRQAQKTDKQYSGDLWQWIGDRLGEHLPKLRWVFFPPDANSFRIQVFHDHMALRGKIAVADDAVLDGIRRTGSLLSAGRLVMLRRCVGLIQEMVGYSWDSKKQAIGQDAPLKVADHGCFVAGTLIKTANGDVPIERISVGDMVWTRSGYRPVIDIGLTNPNASVMTVRFSDGRTLKGTADHPIFVQGKGFLRLDSLRYGDIIESWKTNQSSSGESPSGDTPTRQAGRIAITTHPEKLTSSEESGGSTKRYGKLRTGLFQRVLRFITKISTHSTTIYQTLNVFRGSSTTRFTESETESAAGNGLIRQRAGSISSASSMPRSHGIAQMKAENGTRNMGVGAGTVASLFRRSATSAGLSIARGQASLVIGSALIPANRHGEGVKDSTTKSVRASCVERSSRLIAIAQPSAVRVHVQGFCDGSTEEAVYNLTVADSHEYYANGVLVHNCDALRYGVNGTRRVWVPWLTRAGG